MGRRFRFHLLAQVLAWTIACSMAGIVGLIGSGAIGGIAMGVAPEFAFGLVEGYVCPEGSSLSYTSVRRSYHRPGESEPVIECVAPDGTRQDVVGRSILAVLALSLLAVFVPSLLIIGVPLAIVAYLLGRLVLRPTDDFGRRS